MNIMIVEDEPLIREGLERLLALHCPDMRVACCANNGFEAVAFLERGADGGLPATSPLAPELPDIVITDIRMPGMDGIELLHHMATFYTDIPCIVLSGYDDYGYLRKAVQYQAVDYVMKPLDAQEIVQALERACARRKERSGQQPSDMLAGQLRQFLPLIQETWLNGWIFEELSYMSYPLPPELQIVDLLSFQLGVLYCDYASRPDFAGDREVARLAARQILAETAGDYGPVKVFLTKHGELATIYLYQTYNQSELDGTLRRMKDNIHRYLGIPAFIALSRRYDDIEQLPFAYEECKDIALSRYLDASSTIYAGGPHDLEPQEQRGESFEPFSRAVMKGDAAAAEQALRAVLAELRRDEPDYRTFKNRMITLFLQFGKLVNELKMMQTGSVARKYIAIVQRFDHYDGWQDLSADLHGLADAMIGSVRDAGKDGRNEVHDALRYMEQHYFRTITLKEVAQHVYMSPNYFSSCFKQELGINFVECLNQIRIERSKEILREGHVKSYEVAELVGYRSTQHFSKMFRMLVGMTPMEYKEMTGKRP